jgi:cytochrome c553
MRKKFQGSLLMALAGISVATMAQSARPVAVPRHVQDIITGRCALCHGPEGESASAVYPRLAAQHPDYLQKQLRDFRDGRRAERPHERDGEGLEG